MQTAGLLVFCVLGAIPLTAFVAYPLCLRLLTPLWRPLDPPTEPDDWPGVSLIISAYNEDRIIRERLENALALAYPRDRLEILVPTDGSTDRTDEIVSEYADRNVVLLKTPLNRGKTTALAEAIAAAKHPLLVFSDANSLYDRQALRFLARWMQNERVGCVCGRLAYAKRHETPAELGEKRYWSWDTRLKEWEGRAGYLLGGSGAIFALRKPLAVPLPGEQSNDMVFPIAARLCGYSAVFEPQALAIETTANTVKGEFRRKMRIVARGINGVVFSIRFAFADPEARTVPLMSRLVILLQVMAKKLCRYLAFPAVAGMMLLGPFLTPLWARASAACLWLGLGLAGFATVLHPFVKDRIRRWPNFGYILAVAAAACAGVALFVSGKDVSRWKSQR